MKATQKLLARLCQLYDKIDLILLAIIWRVSTDIFISSKKVYCCHDYSMPFAVYGATSWFVFELCKSSWLHLLLKVLKDDSRFDFKIVLDFLSRCNFVQYFKFNGYWYIAFVNWDGINQNKIVNSYDTVEINLCVYLILCR